MDPFTLIQQLGGHRELARRIGRDHTSVHRWLDRGIPSAAWRDVARIAAERGLAVTVDDLAAMEPAERPALKRGPRPKALAEESA